MINLVRLSNGYYQFRVNWPKNSGIRLRLVLTDPDGDIQEDEFEWKSSRTVPLVVAVAVAAKAIDAIPSWRAVSLGDELAIGTADSDYTGQVEAELI